MTAAGEHLGNAAPAARTIAWSSTIEVEPIVPHVAAPTTSVLEKELTGPSGHANAR